MELQAARGGPSLTAFVVAGGRSRRMGRDKALLAWGERDLLAHALARLVELTPDVRILCGAEDRYQERGRPLVRDPEPDGGALVGIAAGLAATGVEVALFLAVDLPLVPVDLLRALVAAVADADAAVPVTERGPEPLCAAYRRTCLDPIRRRLAAGDRKMTAFWPDVRVRTVGTAEVRAFGDPDRLFLNVNDQDDYQRAASGA
ncbi:MAG: molybdenum cofactor guanylyltransferase [Vicinamibacteria bacterium]